VGWNNIVSTVTHYRVDGPVIESWCGQNFLHPSRTALGPTQPYVQWVLGVIPWGIAARAWLDHPPPSCINVKGRVELYLYSPFWAFMTCFRVKFTIYIFIFFT